MTQRDRHLADADAAVLTPATRAGLGGDAASDADAAVYVIPVAEAAPPKGKRRRDERDYRADAVATLSARDERDWRAPLVDASAGTSHWLRAVCCPCAAAAAVNERLGSSYELALLYFGLLASGLFVFTGLAITYDRINSEREQQRHHDDGFPPPWDASAASSLQPPPHENHEPGLAKSPTLWTVLAVSCVLLFLLGVWLLRTQTRARLAIRGSTLGDLVVSAACACCALGQMDAELRRADERAPDAEPVEPRHDAAATLAGYPTATLV